MFWKRRNEMENGVDLSDIIQTNTAFWRPGEVTPFITIKPTKRLNKIIHLWFIIGIIHVTGRDVLDVHMGHVWSRCSLDSTLRTFTVSTQTHKFVRSKKATIQIYKISYSCYYEKTHNFLEYIVFNKTADKLPNIQIKSTYCFRIKFTVKFHNKYIWLQNNVHKMR